MRATENGLREIRRYLSSGDPSSISLTTRRLAREVVDFLPEVVAFGVDLALVCLWSGQTNTLCRYHHMRRTHVKTDGFDGKYLVEGSAFPKVLGVKGAEGEAQPNHLHCGCSIDDALYEFYIWKTTHIRSTNPRLAQFTESMRDDVIEARPRAFTHAAFKKFTHLTNNDLYNASGTTDGDAHKRAIWTRQLNAIKAAVYESGHKLEVNAVGEFVIA